MGFTRVGVRYDTPGLTLTTANAEGSAAAGIRTDASLLVYDATLPDAITFGQSGATGSAATSSRRDHAHAMANETTNTIAAGAYNDADISIANTTATLITLNTSAYDTDNMHDPVTNNSRIKATTAGTYQILGSIAWASSGTGRRLIYLRYNGSGSGETVEVDTNQNGAHYMQVNAQHVFTADQYVELFVYQSSGGALNATSAGIVTPGLSMQKVIG